MESVRELIAQLNEKFNGWMELIIKKREFSEIYDDEMKNKIYELVFAVKELCIKEEKEAEEVLKELFSDNAVISVLKKQVDFSMVYYKTLEPIRKLSYQDEIQTRKLIKDIFDNYILRFNFEIFEYYTYLDQNNENGVRKIFSSLNRLTDYYTEHLFVQKEVQRDFKEETGISEEICAYYAQLYEDNFKELKMNLILNKLKDLENILNQKENV